VDGAMTRRNVATTLRSQLCWVVFASVSDTLNFYLPPDTNLFTEQMADSILKC